MIMMKVKVTKSWVKAVLANISSWPHFRFLPSQNSSQQVIKQPSPKLYRSDTDPPIVVS